MSFTPTVTQPEVAIVDFKMWKPVRVVYKSLSANPLEVANGATVSGVTLATNDRFLMVSGDDAGRSDAGIYVVGASASTKATDCNADHHFRSGRMVEVLAGVAADRGFWFLANQDPVNYSENSGLVFKLSTPDVQDL